MILPWRVLCAHVARRPTICKIFASVVAGIVDLAVEDLIGW